MLLSVLTLVASTLATPAYYGHTNKTASAHCGEPVNSTTIVNATVPLNATIPVNSTDHARSKDLVSDILNSATSSFGGDQGTPGQDFEPFSSFVTITHSPIATTSSAKTHATNVPATSKANASTSMTSVATPSSSPLTGATHSGRGTFYEVGLGNCGNTNTDDQMVCAISESLYQPTANSDSVSSYCGKNINVSYGGKSITVTVVDSCESCGQNDLDLSPTAFGKLADLDVGVIDIQWAWA